MLYLNISDVVINNRLTRLVNSVYWDFFFFFTGETEEKKDETLKSIDDSFCTGQNEGTKCHNYVILRLHGELKL